MGLNGAWSSQVIFANEVLVNGIGVNAGKYIELFVDASGNPVLAVGNGTPDEMLPGSIVAAVANAGLPNQFLQLNIQGPGNTHRNDQAGFILQSSADDLSGSAGGNAYYRDATGHQTDPLEWGSGGIFARLVQDQNTYDILTKHFVQTANQDFTTTGGKAFNWLTTGGSPPDIPVAAGIIYRIDGIFWCENTVAAVSDIINLFQGTATYSDVVLFVESSVIPTTNPPPANNKFPQLVSSVGNILTPGFGIASGYKIEIHGTIQFATAGTWGAVGAVSSAGDNWSMFQGSYLDFSPKLV